MSMEDKIFDIQFTREGVEYKGWVNPSQKLDKEGRPTSYHVVLNGVSFGYLSFHDCTWTINEERPAGLVEAAGRQIEKHYSL